MEGKIFVFTGKLSFASRDELHTLIENRGGIFQNYITRNTDYLIKGFFGGTGEAEYYQSKKLLMASKYNLEGSNIVVMTENDLIEMIWNDALSMNSE